MLQSSIFACISLALLYIGMIGKGVALATSSVLCRILYFGWLEWMARVYIHHHWPLIRVNTLNGHQDRAPWGRSLWHKRLTQRGRECWTEFLWKYIIGTNMEALGQIHNKHCRDWGIDAAVQERGFLCPFSNRYTWSRPRLCLQSYSKTLPLPFIVICVSKSFYLKLDLTDCKVS